MRPGVAWTPQPSTTGETDASVRVHVVGVHAVCACTAGPGMISRASRAVARNVRGGGGKAPYSHNESSNCVTALTLLHLPSVKQE